MLENSDNKSVFGSKATKFEKDVIEPKPKLEIPDICKGPFKIKAEVIKNSKYRIDGKVYELKPGNCFDASKLTPRKVEILISQKYIRLVNQ